MAYRTTYVDEVPAVEAGVEGLTWRPLRHHLDIRAFGTNAYTATAAGDLVVEPHDEESDEELYVVLRGAARFTVDGETFDAPAGTFVLVTPPSRREAVATAPDTAVLAVGAEPGKAFETSEWETRWLKKGGAIP